MFQHIDIMELEEHTDLWQLPANRSYTETDLRRFRKEGAIDKDTNGFFTFEKRKNIFGEDEIGDKFYIEDSYRHIENLMAGLYAAAYRTQQSVMNLPDAPLKAQVLYASALALDYKLMLLHDLHQGYTTDEFWSPAQIDEWLKESMSTESMFEMMHTVQESPLGVVRRFVNSLKFKLDLGFAEEAPDTLQVPVAVERVAGESTTIAPIPAPTGRPHLVRIK